MRCIDMLAIIIGFLVGVIGVSIIRVIWYVYLVGY